MGGGNRVGAVNRGRLNWRRGSIVGFDKTEEEVARME
jgi:hypothetical protein